MISLVTCSNLLEDGVVGFVTEPKLSSDDLFIHMHALEHIGMYLLDYLWAYSYCSFVAAFR